MSLELSTIDRPAERGRAAETAPRGCPACGPLPSAATSRYCDRHLRQLRAAWLARRPADRPLAA
jgi:hypothetical protein